MSRSSDTTYAEEPSSPLRIGAGSFATVYSIQGRSHVYKVVHAFDRGDAIELKNEYTTLNRVYQNCDSDSVFAIPRPLAFYDPSTEDLLYNPPSSLIRRPRDPRPISVTPGMFSLFDHAAYVMDRAQSLPIELSATIRKLFYPENAKQVSCPMLCRLYFGKVLKTSKFFNSENFPIDIHRYTALLSVVNENELLSIENVVGGMAQMLARFHWVAGNDARDAEFVVGGYDNGVRYYVIDYNQVRPFNVRDDDIKVLVEAIFANDPYYPRPRTEDPMYLCFCSEYLQAAPDEFRERARDFLNGIETEYATKQSVESTAGSIIEV